MKGIIDRTADFVLKMVKKSLEARTMFPVRKPLKLYKQMKLNIAS